MLKTENTNMNMSGSIHQDDIVLAGVSGNFNGNEDFYLHVNVSNYANILENKEIFFADLESFIEQMLETIVDLKD